MKVIEPHPELMRYLADASALFTDFDGGKREFLDNEEWHYIPSELELNIGLLERLDREGLLADEVNVFDCGIGLGSAMFDLYLQSSEMPQRRFTFSGVEKHDRYSDYLEERLMPFWEGRLNFSRGDLMDQDYSGYNLIYTYSPFKTTEKLLSFYEKVASEIASGSVIVESRNFGKGLGDTLCLVAGLEQVRIEDVFSYVGVPRGEDEAVFVFRKK